MSLFQFLNITNSGNEGNDHDVVRAATNSYRKNRKNDKISSNFSNNHCQPKQQPPPLSRSVALFDDEIMVRNSLNAIFDRLHFSLLLQDFLHRIHQTQNCSQHQGSRVAEPSLLSLDFVLKKLFFADYEHVDNQAENFGSALLMFRLKSIDQDVRRFLDKVHEKTRKDDRKAEQCLLQAEKFDAKQSLGYVINFVNQALIFGSDPMIRRALRKRAMVHFDNNDLVNSIQDLLVIMSHWDDCDDIDLIKIGAISFYILAKHSIQKSDSPGSKYALVNLDRAEQLFEKLKIHARMDRNADRQLQYVYRRLKITDTDGFLGELRQHLQCIERLDDAAMKNQEQQQQQQQQQQKSMLTNIFVNDKLEPFATMDGSIRARQRIEANEKLFFETMLTMLIGKDHRHQCCANCYRQIAHGYYPCEYCTEVVFCDVHCRRLSRKHRKTCRFSSIMLMDSTENNHQMALCYEMFASLPIERIIECFEKLFSTSDGSDAMDLDYVLNHPDQYNYSMFSFYNLLSSYKMDMREIHLLNPDHQKRLISALQLGLLMKNQFKLTKSDLSVDDTEKPIDIVDLFKLIGPIFVTLLSLERCALVEKPRFFLRKYPKFQDDHNETEKWMIIGRGLGTFELRIKLTDQIDRANVRRRFANNGKLEFFSTKPIEPGEWLFMLMDKPPSSSSDGNTAQDVDGKQLIQQGYCNRFEPYMQTLW